MHRGRGTGLHSAEQEHKEMISYRSFYGALTTHVHAPCQRPWWALASHVRRASSRGFVPARVR